MDCLDVDGHISALERPRAQGDAGHGEQPDKEQQDRDHERARNALEWRVVDEALIVEQLPPPASLPGLVAMVENAEAEQDDAQQDQRESKSAGRDRSSPPFMI